MFDKIGQVAEKLAVSVSRRSFLGRMGTSALAVAGALGFAASADAGQIRYLCCACRYEEGWYAGCYAWACPEGCRKVRKALCGPPCQ